MPRSRPRPRRRPTFAAALRNVLHWRAIGPARGGRTIAATGVPGRPHEFYVAAVNGGIFKTTDAGRIWTPIFDDQPTASIGALAVAPSAPDTIYAGSGEGRQRPDLAVGDGIYKSTDAGAHWTHLGLARRPADPEDRRRPARSRTASTSRCSGIRTGRTPSAACTARPTAARRSSACSTSTRTAARSTSRSIRPTRARCTPRCGPRASRRGRPPTAARSAAKARAGSTNPPTAARRGSASTAAGRPSRKA